MQTLKRFYQLVAPLWLSAQAIVLWLLLLVVVALTLSVVGISVLYNNWSKDFYDALADFFQHASVADLIWRYLGYTALFVLVIISGNWLKKALILRWRDMMTQHYETQWLRDHAHYRLQQDPAGTPDNPDQRIAEDIRLLCEQSLELLLSLLKNVVGLLSFIAILWGISGVQTFTIGGHTVTIHGYLVWIALIYALVGSILTHALGFPLHRTNHQMQKVEADYRASLIRVNSHSEQIAFYQGDEIENRRLRDRFRAVLATGYRLMGQEFRLESFTVSYFRFSLIVPVFAVLPLYLAHKVSLGAIMQAKTAFGYVLDAFGWFVDSYRQLARWSATIERLWQLQQRLEALPPATTRTPQGEALQIHQLTVLRPQGRALLAPCSARVKPGEWCSLQGASGIGKTTLLRALAGLWPYTTGRWYLPAGRVLFLPQKPYLPQGTLRQALTYPQTKEFSDAVLQEALIDMHLGHLSTELDADEPWAQRLSGGEQQRLSLIRAILMKPTLLCLDEATSQLDEETAIEVMKRLRRHLPGTIVLSVTHQSVLNPLFETQIHLQPASQP
ncbi:ABC transporter ATP-binding protein/permease [Lonsdalea quercina]|uniref:Putative ATP-binding cassette transporter n=1 Tax=Lonsdalea quercina TaxID=71657 RepID=A0A1H4DHU0_9GAMM|nr:ABC transporter ATP-binding protein/permease [Lonsdalea quercina]SEA71812.1 putative ATP-binding cassette transporter [Lonsdalea quercina]